MSEAEARWSGCRRSSHGCSMIHMAKSLASLSTLWLSLYPSTTSSLVSGCTSVWLVCSARLVSTCSPPSRLRYRRLWTSSGNDRFCCSLFVFGQHFTEISANDFCCAVYGPPGKRIWFLQGGYFALNSFFTLVWLTQTVRHSKNNCVKTNKDRHIFWYYKVYAHICWGSVERRR